MATIVEKLKERGVAEKCIVDLDKCGNRSIKTPDQLEAAIESKLVGDGFKYIFMDGVQNVRNYEEVVNAFNTDGGSSCFLECGDPEMKAYSVARHRETMFARRTPLPNGFRMRAVRHRIKTIFLTDIGKKRAF